MRIFSYQLPLCFLFLLGLEKAQASPRCAEKIFGLNDIMSAPTSISERMDRDIALYMLRGLVIWNGSGVQQKDKKWTVRCADIGVEQSSFDALIEADGFLEPQYLSDLYDRSYRNTVKVRGHDAWVVNTVRDLELRTKYLSWPKHTIPVSRIKQKTRRVFRSPNASSAKMPLISVSQTLDSTTGDENAPVLETEVVIQRRDGTKNWDFYSYDKSGKMATYSTFPSGQKPTPQVCMSCHYSPADGSISRFLDR